MVFTTRFSGGKGGRNGFEAKLRRLNVRQNNSRPYHPTTQEGGAAPGGMFTNGADDAAATAVEGVHGQLQGGGGGALPEGGPVGRRGRA